MIIAIDYDNTFTADPEGFTEVIGVLQKRGHTVICVTGRSPDMGEPVLQSIGKLVPVVFASRDWKRVAAEKQGYKVDVWIDDTPDMIAKQTILGSSILGLK